MVRMKLAVVLCSLVTLVASNAFASVHFTQADLLNMRRIGSFSSGFSNTAGSNALSDSPDYFGEVIPPDNPMRGLAGARDELAIGGVVFYGLNQVDTNAWEAGKGGQTLSMVGYNDNNQNWEVGIWYTLQSDQNTIVFDSELLGGLYAVPPSGLPTSAGLSLNLPVANLHRVGVFVRSGGIRDVYHVSWNVPEPGSIFVWSALAMVSIAAGRRNRS